MSVKYKVYFQKMLDENKDLFARFAKIHALFDQDDEKYADEFNTVGKQVQDVAREYENRLCANTERGMYNKYSTGLAEKFQEEIRKKFPLYDHIGIIVVAEPKFTIKKITV